MDTSMAGGINFADTAEGYGDSEEKLSRFLKRDREKKIIATKSPCRDAEGMARAIGQSLKRLKTDYIDLYQVHSLKTKEQLDKVLAPGGALEALKQAQQAGRIRYIGVIAMKPVCGGTLDDPALGIRFCLNSMANTVLVGMKSLAEVEANLKTALEFKPLSQAEGDELLENASQLGHTFCRRCEYCQPCPEGITYQRFSG